MRSGCTPFATHMLGGFGCQVMPSVDQHVLPERPRYRAGGRGEPITSSFRQLTPSSDQRARIRATAESRRGKVRGRPAPCQGLESCRAATALAVGYGAIRENALDERRGRPAHRLRVLVNAGIALSSELSLDALLQRIIETAAEITDASYAALGVIDRTGQSLERFLTTGIDADTHAAIGDLPHGRGILGVLIRDAQPLRLHDIADDPRSVGFPEHHPPMKSFLGASIVLRGVAYGNLYLTEKAGGTRLHRRGLELSQLLAAQAAVAIENARLYESSTRWLRQFESLNEVGNALSSELELEPLLGLVARRLHELVNAKRS